MSSSSGSDPENFDLGEMDYRDIEKGRNRTPTKLVRVKPNSKLMIDTDIDVEMKPINYESAKESPRDSAQLKVNR